MSSPIEKAKAIIAKGELATAGPWTLEGDNRYGHRVCSEGARPPYHMVVHADGYVSDNTEADASYIAAANPADLLPVLRLLVEMADKLQEHADFQPEIDPAEGDCDPWIRIAAHGKKMARALLDKLRSES